MSLEDNEILDEFVVESTEHLADIENQFLTIEAGGADIDVELVNTVFRAVHSIKGAAGFLGLTSINKLSHSMENVLNLMRDRALVPDSKVIDVLLRGADDLRGMIGAVRDSNSVDVTQRVTELERIAAGESPASNSTETADPLLDASGQVESDEVGDETADASEAVPDEPRTAPQPAPIATAVRQTTSPETATPTRPAATTEAAPATPQASPSSTQAGVAESNIRVSVEVLDRLMNLAGELVLGRNQLNQTVASDDKAGLDTVATRLDQITSELQEAIMKTRMQPIGNVFNRFSRVVRDLSGKLGKQCELIIEGKEVEVDKTIIEAIGDPLTHLVRNSVDHGIEMPDVRRGQGKPVAGKLSLRAYHRSGKVRIDIEDDGKGIDAEFLKQKAIAKGLITLDRAQQMSEREAVRLILHPGFSTATAVTDVSGRGVGMDVVRSNIERLGGSVEIETAVGRGTTIQVTLPLTLAIIPSLIVECDGHRFALPQVNIAELVRIRENERNSKLGRVKNSEVLRLRGSLLPLIRLRDALDLPPDGARPTIQNIIVVESGLQRYGLVVDDLFDSEEIVVKPLGRHLKDTPCISGATILGDGRVALILDVAGIAMRTNLRDPEETKKDAERAEQGKKLAGERQPVLLFTNAPHEHFAAPMDLVARIERIRGDQIDTVGGHDLLQYRGGSLPLLCLEKLITADPRPDLDRLYVVVFATANHEVGLLAPRLVDIRQVAANFDTLTFDEEGVSGSQVIDGHATRLLDLFSLARKARPDWFREITKARQPAMAIAPAAPTGDAPPTTSRTVLLAEDSNFFRRQLTSFLEAEGYEIVGCEDGAIAWETLSREPDRFGLVLTDIEMPNMDGLQFTRLIRADERFTDMPVIALTSLAGQDDQARGRAPGVNEYQIKLDREQLIRSVAQLLDGRSRQPLALAGSR